MFVSFLAMMVYCNMGAEITLQGKDFLPAKAHEKVEVHQSKDLALKPGSVIRIQLPIQAGTGYQWQLLGPEFGPLELKGTRVIPSMRMVPGASALQEFEFTTRLSMKGGAQQTVLVFNLRRSFEGLGPRVYQVRVQVGEM